jgi:N-formylglutamate amidohydrolase
MHPAYRLLSPSEPTTSVVVASPHSGRHYPRSFLRSSMLDERSIRSSEDAFMDMLVEAAPELGAPLLAAEYPRAYIDLNRSADELDPGVIDGVGRVVQTPRISSGLGVIPRVVANGRAIYRGKLDRAEADERIERIWHPYHQELDRLMQGAHDRFGASARGDLVDALETAFLQAGLVVSRNAPFAGAYVTQRYGRPMRGWHAVQIEIDRSLYMNERLIRPNGNFDNVRRIVTSVIARAIEATPGAMSLAAE